MIIPFSNTKVPSWSVSASDILKEGKGGAGVERKRMKKKEQ